LTPFSASTIANATNTSTNTAPSHPGRTQPRAAYPGAAAQTRVVSLVGIRFGSWESARARLVSPAQASLPRSWPTLRIPNAVAQTRMVSVARLRLDSGNLFDLSKGYFASTFLSSSRTTPATQSGLHQPLADDRRCYRRKGKKSPRTLRKTAGLSVRLLAGWGPRGRESVRRFLEARCALPRNHVVVKHSADSGCVGHPVAKCREAPLLFSAVNLRSQDRRGKRYRRGACRGS